MSRAAIVAIISLAVLAVAGAAAVASGRADLAPQVPGRQTVAAPIDRLEVKVLTSNPPQVRLAIAAGLPSGCAKRESHTVKRGGDTITVTVLNSLPTGNPICTMIYGTYELDVDLGTDFRSGVTYTVLVNDKSTTFRV